MSSILSSVHALNALRAEGWMLFSPEDVTKLPLVDLSGFSLHITDPAALELGEAGWLTIPPARAGEYASFLADARAEEERTTPSAWRRHAYAMVCITLTAVGWMSALTLVVSR